MFLSHDKLSHVKSMLGVRYVFFREELFPVKFMLGIPYVSSREKLFPVKFMYGVRYVSSPWKTIPREIYAWCPICFFPWKTISREIYVWCPICFFLWKTIRVKFMLGVLYVSFPWKTIPTWNLCLVSHMFFPVKTYFLCNLCLVSHLFFRRLNRPPVSFTLVADAWRPQTRHSCWKFIVIALCAQLTHDLLAIAVFLSHVSIRMRENGIAIMSVCLSVCPSVRQVSVFHLNGIKYHPTFFFSSLLNTFAKFRRVPCLLPVKNYPRGNFMRSHLRVAATSRTWRQPSSPRSRKQGCHKVSSRWKNIPVKFTLTVGGHSVATKATVVAKGVTNVSSPSKTIPQWNLCFRQWPPPPVSHICFLPMTNSPPLRFTVVTEYALLMRDLLATAKCLVCYCVQCMQYVHR